MTKKPEFTRADLDKVLASSPFHRSPRLCRFLEVLVERALSGDPRIKEIEIGVSVYQRPVGYDPKSDSIVRTEATRLRQRLRNYYDNEGRHDAIRLSIAPGRYEVEFVATTAPLPPIDLPPSPPRRWWIPAAAAFAVVAAGVFGIVRWPTSAAPVALAAVPFTSTPGVESHPAISPDGGAIAFADTAIYVQQVGAANAVRLTEPAAPSQDDFPVWSPDGRSLAFLRKRDEVAELRLMPAAGGVETLCATLRGAAAGLSWSPDGRWLATAEARDDGRLGLVLISPQTGAKRSFDPESSEPGSLHDPVFSPDGGSLAYVRSWDSAVADVFTAPVAGGREQRITHDRIHVQGLAWAPGGGSLIVSSPRAAGRPSLWRVYRDGREPVRLTDDGVDSLHPTFARRAARLAFSRRGDDVNIWRVAADQPGSAGTLLIASSGIDTDPQYSPDGRSIAFTSNRSGTPEIWISDAEGRAVRRLTRFHGPVAANPRWSPDGRRIAFDVRAAGNTDIYIATLDGAVRRVTSEPSHESRPLWSGDGQVLYYTSDRDGVPAFWQQPVNESKEPPRVAGAVPEARDGARSPDGRWRLDSRLDRSGADIFLADGLR